MCIRDSNLFIVRSESSSAATTGTPVLWTPPLSAGCLEGVTRNLVIALARDAGFTVREENITRHDLYTCDELFLTGSGAEVVPVVNIDRRPVGTGKPGPVTKQLITAFRELMKNAPED